ncbi:MAG: ParB/RepB/Spo0J family partition protein [Acidobacteriota bacterium]
MEEQKELFDIRELQKRTILPKKVPRINMISIEKIRPNPNQPRNEMGNLEDLVQSIKSKGILEPILVRKKEDYFEIITGERRHAAALFAELKEIPCIELDIPDNEALEISLIENLHRKDLNPFEEAFALKALSDVYGYTHQKISEKIGKSRVYVTEMISITKLPAEIIRKCQEKNVNSKSVLVQLTRLHRNEKETEKIIEKIKERELKREDLRRIKREREKPYIFSFRPESKEFSLRLRFKRKEVEKQEIIRILEEILRKLKEE